MAHVCGCACVHVSSYVVVCMWVWVYDHWGRGKCGHVGMTVQNLDSGLDRGLDSGLNNGLDRQWVRGQRLLSGKVMMFLVL